MKKLSLIALFPAALLLIHAVYSYRQYNVIVITIDTFRRDHSTCYNPSAPPTPHIDRIAGSGVLFENSYSLIPITLPSHTAIFSSRPPHEIDVFNNGDILQRKAPMLSDYLSEKGYSTGAFVSMGVLKKVFGLHQGFQTYNDEFKFGRYYRVASEMNAVALPWIETHKDRPFFAWIHYCDPHEPYITVDAPPDTEVIVNGASYDRVVLARKEHHNIDFVAQPGENILEFKTIGSSGVNGRITEYMQITLGKKAKGVELLFAEDWKVRKREEKIKGKYFEGQGTVLVMNQNREPVPVRLTYMGKGKIFQTLDVIRKNYKAEVQYVDRYVGELWDKLESWGIRDKTILILTSDHGEALAEHKRVGHLFPLYREVVEVPLIVYYPGLGHKGRRVGQIVNSLDILPTVLDLMHIKSKAPMNGQSLKYHISRSPVDWLFAKPPDRSRTFFYTYAPQGKANTFALQQRTFKLIQTKVENGWNWEAYDLAKDPGEQSSLVRGAGFEDPRLTPLRSFLEEQSREAEEAHGRHQNPVLDEEQKKMLRDLGYIAR